MLTLKYPSQRLAHPFFISMLIFFLLQITYGLTMAWQQVDPFFLQGILNFNVNRSTHVNLAVVWVLTGLIGALLYMGPILAGRDVGRAWLTRLLLIVIWANVLWTAVAMTFAQVGNAGWAFGQPWFQEGLEFLEAGRITDIFLWIGFMIVAYLILRIFRNVRTWTEIHWALAVGVLGLVVFWAFGMFFIPALDLQEYFRWFVIHYWVEAIWEILYVGLVGFLLLALFGGDRKVIGIAVFWGMLLAVMSGLIGNGHHYFWIGTPSFWQFWGSLFSALEPLPIILGIWHVFLHPSRTGRRPANRAAFYFLFGSSLFEVVGAGILGFTQGFAVTNVWEHGTWITPAHGHLALFGTFGMLAVAAAYAVIPQIKGITRTDDRLSRTGFWLILAGILGMVLSFGLGGTVEVYIYRVLAVEWFGAVVRPAMAIWKVLLFTFGSVFALGVLAVSYDLFTLRQLPAGVESASPSTSWWRKPLTALEMGIWLAVLWIIGLVLTAALLVNNLPSVRAGDPTIPYVLAGIGYPALVLTTAVFAVRFLRACDVQAMAASGAQGRTMMDPGPS
ncbi:MAG TPA: cbb3-type cytochrome c oxidase subunit I [Anaerolineales bacterium]|nr:cbb3-type cytochrome c oxidase subunit I [Anaerolineales bacterium]